MKETVRIRFEGQHSMEVKEFTGENARTFMQDNDEESDILGWFEGEHWFLIPLSRVYNIWVSSDLMEEFS